MPKLNKVYTLEITPEQFLNSCSPVELQEISLLLSNNFYQSRLQSIMVEFIIYNAEYQIPNSKEILKYWNHNDNLTDLILRFFGKKEFFIGEMFDFTSIDTMLAGYQRNINDDFDDILKITRKYYVPIFFKPEDQDKVFENSKTVYELILLNH
ncbi:hypothetical protein CMT56_18120 [Elizabethkingia anophelis]|nr:hypothetical protein [Elizabethkingia anophelis]MDV3863425.1 hypothetical protein [Elizabethkingia anophelis]MDV3910601.1 hypothetical protein [Elizabethkingia anophelis]MDV3925291.1 hypothetical protein [Elizabethkingia anophelis]MDV3989928.1 hypothetical protein [Elizabethkingia anophelis]